MHAIVRVSCYAGVLLASCAALAAGPMTDIANQRAHGAVPPAASAPPAPVPVTARPAASSGATGATAGHVSVSPNRARLLQAQVVLRDTVNRSAAVARNTPLTTQMGARKSFTNSLASAKTPSTAEQVAGWPAGIWLVNTQERDVSLTPGGYVTIVGKGFGDAPGQVYFVGRTTDRAYLFQVLLWSDQLVLAVLPANLRGVIDQEASLRVVPRDGQTYMFDGATFYATREEQVLTSNLDRVIELRANVNGAFPWAAVMTPAGSVVRHYDQNPQSNIFVCPPPGTDVLAFKPLSAGFVVSGISATFGRTDTGSRTDSAGKSGYREFHPGYALGDWGTTSLVLDRLQSVTVDEIPVSWGVWFDHSAKGDFSFGYPDQCDSRYQVAVWVVGPAGVQPF